MFRKNSILRLSGSYPFRSGENVGALMIGKILVSTNSQPFTPSEGYFRYYLFLRIKNHCLKIFYRKLTSEGLKERCLFVHTTIFIINCAISIDQISYFSLNGSD